MILCIHEFQGDDAQRRSILHRRGIGMVMALLFRTSDNTSRHTDECLRGILSLICITPESVSETAHTTFVIRFQVRWIRQRNLDRGVKRNLMKYVRQVEGIALWR